MQLKPCFRRDDWNRKNQVGIMSCGAMRNQWSSNLGNWPEPSLGLSFLTEMCSKMGRTLPCSIEMTRKEPGAWLALPRVAWQTRHPKIPWQQVFPNLVRDNFFAGATPPIANRSFSPCSPIPPTKAASRQLHLALLLPFLLVLYTPSIFNLHKMQRALSSRARATALSSVASRYRAGAGLSQQLRFAHKVRKMPLESSSYRVFNVSNKRCRSSSLASKAAPLSWLVLIPWPKPSLLPSVPRVEMSSLSPASAPPRSPRVCKYPYEAFAPCSLIRSRANKCPFCRWCHCRQGRLPEGQVREPRCPLITRCGLQDQRCCR